MTLAFTQAQKALSSIRSLIPRLVTTGVVVRNEPILYVDPPNVPAVMDFLKNHTGTRCKQLVDVTAIDIPTREKRFEVCYQLLSIDHNSRMRVKTQVGGHEGDDGVPSLVDLFNSANWYEREVWDMYGIYFGEPRPAVPLACCPACASLWRGTSAAPTRRARKARLARRRKG
jgi:NADH:ubiquinone oxidoreductase subunit C